MKRYAAAICLVLMVVNGSVYYLYFSLQQIAIKTEKNRQLKITPMSQLDKLEISLQQFEKAKVEENEIRIGGRMFDVAKAIQVNDDQLILYGIYDTEEDDLLAFLECLTADDKQGRAPAFVISSLQLFFDLPLSEVYKSKTLFQSAAGRTLYCYPQTNVTLNTESPPPRFLA
jgi:hypothetical protein